MNAVVTGASGDIGGEIVRILAENGYDIALMYNNNGSSAKALADEITSSRKARVYKCNLQNPQEIADTANAILHDFGSIDLVVNNAGISLTGLATDFSADDFGG